MQITQEGDVSTLPQEEWEEEELACAEGSTEAAMGGAASGGEPSQAEGSGNVDEEEAAEPCYAYSRKSSVVRMPSFVLVHA